MTTTRALTDGPVTKSLILFAVPILLSNLLQQLYNSIDSAVVGHFAGSSALAAVGSTGSLINLLIGFFLGIATGTGVLYAMHYGAEDYPGLKKLIDSAMVISISAGAFITLVGMIFCRPLLQWIQTPEDVLPLGVSYLRIYFAGTIINLVYNVGAGMIRAEGDSTRPLIYLFISGIANLILDLLLVAVFDMGVAGAAIATVAAQTISAILVVMRLTRLDARYRFHPLQIKPDKTAVWDIIRISVPCGLQGSMFNISNFIVQSRINTFGTVAMAGITAYSRIDGFIYMPMGALGLTVSTYVGQNIGAGKFDRVRRGIRVCLAMCIGFALLVGWSVFFCCRPLLRLFTDDPSATEYALNMMHYLAPFAFLLGFSDILGGAIRGAGHPMKVTVISALCICAFRIIWLVVLLPVYHDIRILYLCYPLSWSLSSLAIVIYYFSSSVIRRTLRQTTSAEK